MQKISWTDTSWEPTIGCSPIGPGCAHCYARELSERRRGTYASPCGFSVAEDHRRLDGVNGADPGSTVLVSSMSDLFHDRIGDAFRGRVVDAIARRNDVAFVAMTKRVERAAGYFSTRRVPGNLWLGVSIENQDYAWRADVLRAIKATTRFISAEPLLGPLELDLRGISWLIVGGESGRHIARGSDRALVEKTDGKWVPRGDRVPWVESLRDQASRAGCAFFFKGWGGPRPESGGDLLLGVRHHGYPSMD